MAGTLRAKRRRKDRRPLLDRLAPITHCGFYVLVLFMAGTGFATAIPARLNEIVFAGSGDPLPPTFATVSLTLARRSA
jgi:hypothetical protein